MKILVFLLVFIAISAMPWAHAEIIERGKDFDREFIGHAENGAPIFQWSSKPDRVFDGVGWVDRIVSNNGTHFNVYSNHGSFSFNTDTCTITQYVQGFNPITETAQGKDIAIKEWYWTIARKNGANPWSVIDVSPFECNITPSSNSTGKYLSTIRTDPATGSYLKVDMAAPNDEPVKDFNELFMNRTAWSGNKFAFVLQANGINANTVTLRNGTTLNIPDGITVIDRSQLTVDSLSFVKNGNAFFFDWMKAKDNFKTLMLNKTGTNIDAQFGFNNNAPTLTTGQKLFMDPTFGYTAGGWYRITTTGDCSVFSSNGTTNGVVGSEGTLCLYKAVWWYPAIPPSSDVTNVNMRYDVSSNFGPGLVCSAVEITSNPQTTAAATIQSQIRAGANFTDFDCYTVAANVVVDLGPAADADVEEKMDSGAAWYLGMRKNPDNLGASYGIVDQTEIEITYQVAPPTNFACSSDGDEVLCTWDAPSPASGVDTYYIGRSLDNSTWPAGNKTNTGNMTSATLYTFRANQLYYLNVTALFSGDNSTADYTSVTTDDYPNAPGTSDTEGSSDTSIIIRWLTPTNDGNDAINGYCVNYYNHTAPNGWEILIANTTTININYNHTGLHAGHTYTYRVCAGNGVGFGLFSSNMTASSFEAPDGTVSIATGNIGDTIQFNATVTMTAGSPDPTVTQLEILRDNVVVETRAENVVIPSGSSDTLDPAWYQILDGNSHDYAVRITATNGIVSNSWVSTINATITREYDPNYTPSITDPSTLGDVNATVSRFDSQDGVQLKVNRINVASGETWTLNCIAQTNAEAASTRNQSLSWPGTWRNYSLTGYGNTTWTGFSGDHAYITCVNPPSIIFTTTSFTNSSLALFGIQIFDESYGAMLGVPVGVFFLVLVAGMANKRTAPTFIIVLLGMAGVLSTLLFFTVNPLVWGLALVTGLLGALVNQKVF